jgi:hypothetical protein
VHIRLRRVNRISALSSVARSNTKDVTLYSNIWKKELYIRQCGRCKEKIYLELLIEVHLLSTIKFNERRICAIVSMGLLLSRCDVRCLSRQVACNTFHWHSLSLSLLFIRGREGGRTKITSALNVLLLCVYVCMYVSFLTAMPYTLVLCSSSQGTIPIILFHVLTFLCFNVL